MIKQASERQLGHENGTHILLLIYEKIYSCLWTPYTRLNLQFVQDDMTQCDRINCSTVFWIGTCILVYTAANDYIDIVHMPMPVLSPVFILIKASIKALWHHQSILLQIKTRDQVLRAMLSNCDAWNIVKLDTIKLWVFDFFYVHMIWII